MLDYRIVERAPFTIVGMKRSFDSDTSYQEIPKYLNEWTSVSRASAVKAAARRKILDL